MKQPAQVTHLHLPKLSLPPKCLADNTELVRVPRASPHNQHNGVRTLSARRHHTPLTISWIASLGLSSLAPWKEGFLRTYLFY